VLTALIDWSLRHRFHAVAGPLGLAVLGLFPLDSLNIDAFPDTTPVQVQINTIAPGLVPREVESQITAPVEQGIGSRNTAIPAADPPRPAGRRARPRRAPCRHLRPARAASPRRFAPWPAG
jgi:hypothetical protein